MATLPIFLVYGDLRRAKLAELFPQERLSFALKLITLKNTQLPAAGAELITKPKDMIQKLKN